MTVERLEGFLAQIHEAACDALAYVDGLTKKTFLGDKRTQQAVVLNLLIMGEAAAKVLERHPHFATGCPAAPWGNMKGMRNRIAHGYYEIDVSTVWETVRRSLPALLEALPVTVAPSPRSTP